ncbi:hypothetical protein MJO28_011404 [Puccinia striiformis f. sp. tritici]|uniref:Uncharacterized protein n=1 Tax=Puccinia striiformis f. sp. tritici TaxID=168172 RepID=A0ACC0E3A9_9BASI|nr:hypothetical protein MJO28_011404 [Puccinia striiformis f. sp. tritici]
MSTRRAANPLLPISDPEAIIRAANSEKRRIAQLASSANPTNSITFPTPSNSITTMSDNPPAASNPPTGQGDSADKHPASTMSTEDMLRAFIQVQHAAALQSASRMERLEDAVMELSLKSEPSDRPLPLAPGRIDLQRFKTSNGPHFSGPFQAVEPFVTWINGVQIFFATKAVGHSEDKIRILGCLIRESNLLTFYANGVDELVTKSWDDFKSTLFKFALPPLWRTELRAQIRYLKMLDSERFVTFSTRARTLQNMVNFDAPTTSKVDDFNLAESVTLGLPTEVSNLINNHQLLRANPFVYSEFEFGVSVFHEGLPRLPTGLPLRTLSGGSALTWTPRVNATFARSNAAAFRVRARDPSTSDGKPFRIHSKLHLNPPTTSHLCLVDHPTNRPAGRPSNRLASVAGITDNAGAPALDSVSIQALEALNEELRLCNEEVYVPAPVTPRLIIDFMVNGIRLRALIDSGAEINLISEAAAARARLPKQNLPKPTTVRLALDDSSSLPIILCYFTVATLADPDSPQLFNKVALRLGPISGGHDMILGTLFLAQFHLSLCISDQSLYCVSSNIVIHDYRRSAAINHLPTCVSAVSSPSANSESL